MYVFLEQLAARLGMRMRGGDVDTSRAAKWFVEWWRREGGLISAASAPRSIRQRCVSQGQGGSLEGGDDAIRFSGPIRRGWGFDFEWTVDEGGEEGVEAKMGACIDAYVKMAEVQEEVGGDVSRTQERKRAWEEKLAKSRAKASRKSG